MFKTRSTCHQKHIHLDKIVPAKDQKSSSSQLKHCKLNLYIRGLVKSPIQFQITIVFKTVVNLQKDIFSSFVTPLGIDATLQYQCANRGRNYSVYAKKARIVEMRPLIWALFRLRLN